MIETIPRYKKFVLDTETMGQSVYIQTIAKITPKRMTWPDEPWTLTGVLDKILKSLRDKYHGG